MSTKLAKRTQLKKQDPKDLFKAVAMDIGKNVASYIEVMYPNSVKACSSTFLLSVRNSIYNEIMAAIEVDTEEETLLRLKKNREFRRWWKAAYRNIRKNDSRVSVPQPPEPSEHERS